MPRTKAASVKQRQPNWRDEMVLTVPEAALVLKISRTKMYEMLLRGEIGSCKAGTRRLVSVRSLEAWLDAGEQSA